MMSREIDNNPFLVFTIHNVDLLEELKKRGVTVDEAAKTAAVPSVKDVVEFRKPAKEVGKEAPEFHRVNFSRLSDRLDVLLMLLPPNPAFDLNGDFKERYSSQMRKSAAMRSNSLKANSRPRGFSRLRRFPMNIMNMPFPEIRPCRWKRICC